MGDPWDNAPLADTIPFEEWCRIVERAVGARNASGRWGHGRRSVLPSPHGKNDVHLDVWFPEPNPPPSTHPDEHRQAVYRQTSFGAAKAAEEIAEFFETGRLPRGKS